jgi:hypothetical protein
LQTVYHLNDGIRQALSTVTLSVSTLYAKQCDCISSMNTDLKQHGPHDTTRHSRWPIFLRIRGSVVPAMILPLTFISLWSSCVTIISKFVYEGSKYFIPAVAMFPNRSAGVPRHISTSATPAKQFMAFLVSQWQARLFHTHVEQYYHNKH